MALDNFSFILSFACFFHIFFFFFTFSFRDQTTTNSIESIYLDLSQTRNIRPIKIVINVKNPGKS